MHIKVFKSQKLVNICAYSSTHLVKELLSYGVRLDGKLQLCIHGGHTNIDLQKM